MVSHKEFLISNDIHQLKVKELLSRQCLYTEIKREQY